MIRRSIEKVRRNAGRRDDRSDGNGLVLMYHRVAELRTDPWSLSVTPKHFAEQLEVLRQYVRPIPLQRLFQELVRGDLPGRFVVVTFDDGYADNLYNAKPLLERYDVPATVFLTTGFIGHEREFWWDELDRLLVQPGALPKVLSLSVNGSTYRWNLRKGTGRGSVAARFPLRSSTRRDRKARRRLYHLLWQLLHPLNEGERQKVLEELRVWAGVGPAVRSTHRSLSREEVMDLARGKLVEIGAHTVTHPALSGLPPDAQRREIVGSKTQLEEMLGQRVDSFAYPHGLLSNETASIVREAGFARACSTVADVTGPGTDRFRLPRVQVEDWEGDRFARWLSGWFRG